MLYIDASRHSNTAKRTGVENYSLFLINELAKEHPKEITLISPKKIDLKVKQLIIPFPRLWTQIRLSWEIFRNKKIDNIFVPSHVLPLICPKKSTITIHDVAFKDSPKSYSLASRIYLDWATKFAVKYAKNIIVPSKKTHDDLIKYYACSPKKIKIIALGYSVPKLTIKNGEINDRFKKYGLVKGEYFLYIGRIEHKKNTDNLIKAFDKFSKKNHDIKLVIAGGRGHGADEIIHGIPDNLRKKIIMPGYIDETDKQILLKYATAFIFPSREEGFGIPLLEAMHAGIPIIASAIPTSKEIAEENAHFFETENYKELFKKMKYVVENSSEELLKIDKHQGTLKKYTWEECAQKTYEVISS